MRKRTYRCCSVVGGIGCHAPANFEGPPSQPLTRCYVCGDDICRDPGCSLVVRTTGPVGGGKVRTRRRVRMCWYCVEREHGTEEARRLTVEAYVAPERGA